jgi:DNA-binding LytR/AlgR family response regulator
MREGNMATRDEMLTEEITERLNWLCPKVWALPVDMWGDRETIRWIRTEDICFMTTEFELGDYVVMIVTADGEKYYTKSRLGELEEKLKDNPRFMRSTRSMIINLQKIVRSRNSSARDLWFEGIEEVQINAVSGTNLNEYKERFEEL